MILSPSWLEFDKILALTGNIHHVAHHRKIPVSTQLYCKHTFQTRKSAPDYYYYSSPVFQCQ